PRILALAEVAWSNEERKSYDNFRERALVENNYLDSKGYSVFDLKTEIGNRKEASEEKQHLAVGKKVIYNAPFNTSYPAAGESTLTDGQYGGWTYSDGRWQGFISAKRLDVTIDLEKDTDISSISADFMQVVGPEVFLPVEVIISASSDGQTYETLYTATHEINKSSAVVFEKHLWSGTSKARYVRFEAKASREIGGWIFTDEIVIE
ncbi:MAG: discoidin domain-containing protein, partial [Rikenellaceae bacterium]